MVKLRMPVTGPLTAAVFPTVSRYDPTPPDPVNWMLKIDLESTSSITLQAVCDGFLSTVPPDQVLGPEFKTVKLSETTRPAATRFYLQPDAAVVTGLQNELVTANLGYGVKWFSYEDVDTNTLADVLRDAIAERSSQGYSLGTTEDDEKAFLLGQSRLHVKAGDVIGLAAENFLAEDVWFIRFGVFTSTGYIDPVHFYNIMQNYVEGEMDADAPALNSLVGTDWPYVARDGNVNTLISETEQKLYPSAVLQEARGRLPWVSESQQWREIAEAQKVQFLERLYNSVTGAGPSFRFHTDEMVNPYQLEAVTEFFMFWKDPGLTSQPPVIDDFTQLREVDFSAEDDFHLVMIDPFNDPKLGSPELPKPDWFLLSWEQKGSNCHPYGPLGPLYPPDEYNGVLFLVYKGQVEGWYRWSSFSSHRFEDTNEPGGCTFSSSIRGNLKYKFWSKTSPNFENINYGFEIWYDGDDPEILAMRQSVDPDTWSPGRFYFRGGIPEGIPDDEDGKTDSLLHFGITKHDLETDRAEETFWAYSGSAGCIVSPSFYIFRAKVCHLFLLNNSSIDEAKRAAIRKIQDANSNEKSVELWKSDYESKKLMNQWGSNDTKANGYTIFGTFWVIRPDEPTPK